ncbi:MAG: MiaB/RimO family radical SAM methylthiotransferase [Tepidisphaerales bacterium]
MSPPRTFHIQTLGCRTNAAESEQLARLLQQRGLERVQDPSAADLRLVNTCSVTTAAAAQSRQTLRKAVSLPLLSISTPGESGGGPGTYPGVAGADEGAGRPFRDAARPRVVAMGCWATSDPAEAAGLPGVDAVLTHHEPATTRLQRLLDAWGVPPRRLALPVWGEPASPPAVRPRQRAYLKVQDGCDAHCTYCIIPRLRPRLWSMGPDEAVREVRRCVHEGHREVVLTGIFLGATGQPTALRRRQTCPGGTYLAELVRRIARDVPELPRLRLSSIEPGDLTDDLLEALSNSPQVVPHFHLPLQSGSDRVLRRMNRQYRRTDFLKLVETLRRRFDRPALTTDILVGFPGETEGDFLDTLAVVDEAAFLHVHAFPFSPRPGTAAARWTRHFVSGDVVRERMQRLRQAVAVHDLTFRRQFVGEVVEVVVEGDLSADGHPHGRCERYFDVELPHAQGLTPGQCVSVRVVQAEQRQTVGRVLDGAGGRRLGRLSAPVPQQAVAAPSS